MIPAGGSRLEEREGERKKEEEGEGERVMAYSEGAEGDEIILLAFRSLDCKSFNDDVKRISELKPEHLLEIISKSIRLISTNEIKLNSQLPVSVAARQRICTDVAIRVKALGYTGECGYNQILYPTESQSKALLSWLVQKLPRSEEEITEESLGPNALLNKRMIERMAQWKSAPWLLPFSVQGKPPRTVYYNNHLQVLSAYKQLTTKDIYNSCGSKKVPPESTIFEKHSLELMADAFYAANLENDLDELKKNKANMLKGIIRNGISAAKHEAGQNNNNFKDLINSISNANSGKNKLERGTRFSHATEFEQERDSSIGAGNTSVVVSSTDDADEKKRKQEEEEREREEELENLRAELMAIQQQIESQERQNVNAAAKMRQLESELAALLSEEERLQQELLVKKKTLEMLPQAAQNIAKLQELCAANAKKLMTLAQEWESHRLPLIAKLREKKSIKSMRKNKFKEMVDDMKRYREDMVSMISDLKEKQEKSQILNDEVSKIPKNINRNIYTHRIMDIITSIGKQNKDIAKITGDIRDVQKTINSTTTAMQRADAVAEELVFTAANAPASDPATVETYKRLRTMRNKFEALIDAVSKIGSNDKNICNYETKIDQEMSRVNNNNFDRIKHDLESVLKENQQLIAQIKATT